MRFLLKPTARSLRATGSVRASSGVRRATGKGPDVRASSKRLRIVLLTGAVAGIALTAVLASSAAARPASHQAKTYNIVFSNNYAGNDWRQELEALAKASVKYPPFKGRINYKLVRPSSQDAPAQISSLNDIIQTRPDAIVIEPSSPTALNQVIARACALKIVVVTVDANVTAPCAYQVSTDWFNNGLVAGEWIGKTMGGKGSVFLDRGLTGVSLSADLLRGYQAGLKKVAPKITVAGYYESKFAAGPEQSGVADLLSAHPTVGGIFASGYGSGSIKALQAAGKKLVPIAGYSYNVSMTACATIKGAQCILATNAPYLAVQGMKIALDVLDGKTVKKKTINTPTFFTTNSIIVPGNTFQRIKVGVNAFPKDPPGLFLPFKAPFMPQLTLNDALGKG
jgi:ribose transport system substrate-binding protein